jgi:plasmid stabilization system protein ParE
VRVVLHPEAIREANEAADWYEVRRVGYGQRYRDSILATLATIAAYPLSYPVEPDTNGARRALVRQFPLSLRIMHVKRKSLLWRFTMPHDFRGTGLDVGAAPCEFLAI